jgi:hypothetical protein
LGYNSRRSWHGSRHDELQSYPAAFSGHTSATTAIVAMPYVRGSHAAGKGKQEKNEKQEGYFLN